MASSANNICYDKDMNLLKFFPYRVARLADAVSRAVAPVYAERFGLSRDEWRVLAALAEENQMKTTDLIAHTTLDKMQVSRALARMESAALIERAPDPEDGRARIVRPTGAARKLYQKIVPMVQAREAFLLEALTPQEREVLLGAMDKVMERALQLERQG